MLQSNSALGPEGHCNNIVVSCVFHVYGFWTSTMGRGQAHVGACGQGEGKKSQFSCGRHKWMTLYGQGLGQGLF